MPILRSCIDRERESSPDRPARTTSSTPVAPSLQATPNTRIQYVIVRSDLPHGVQVAQTAHAASEASGAPQTIVVALAVPDEPSLRELSAMLAGISHGHALIVEDAGPYAGQATAIGVSPLTDRAAIRKVTSQLPLVR